MDADDHSQPCCEWWTPTLIQRSGALRLAFAAGLVASRFAGPFNPPFWAHLYTGTVGLVPLLG